MVENGVYHCVMSGRHNFATEKEMSPFRSRKAGLESDPHSPMESRRKAARGPVGAACHSASQGEDGRDGNQTIIPIQTQGSPVLATRPPAQPQNGQCRNEGKRKENCSCRHMLRSIRSGTSQIPESKCEDKDKWRNGVNHQRPCC